MYCVNTVSILKPLALYIVCIFLNADRQCASIARHLVVTCSIEIKCWLLEKRDKDKKLVHK